MTREQKKHYYEIMRRALELHFPILVDYNGTVKQEDVDKVVYDFIKGVSGEIPDTELDARTEALLTLINNEKVTMKNYVDGKRAEVEDILTALKATVDDLVVHSAADSKAYTDAEINKVKTWFISYLDNQAPTDAEIQNQIT